MDEKNSYRGFVKITEDCSEDSPYAVFRCDINDFHPIIYRNPHATDTWCLGSEELNIHDFNLCPACTVDSWKSAIDIAIIKLHNCAREAYKNATLMFLNGAPGNNTGAKYTRFKGPKRGKLGAPCYEANFDKFKVQVYQDDIEYGEGKPWYMVCNDVGIRRGYSLGVCTDANCAINAAIAAIKNRIDGLHTIACSLEI